MLVLTRRMGERIRLLIGDTEVWITVIDRFDGNKVKLGITAPPAVKIIREELIWEQQDREKK